MPPKGSRAVKVRITASFDPAVFRTIDRLAKVTGHSSRSRLIEEALQCWITAQQRRNLEQQIEAYYLSLSSLSEAEREEDREWAEGASRPLNRGPLQSTRTVPPQPPKTSGLT